MINTAQKVTSLHFRPLSDALDAHTLSKGDATYEDLDTALHKGQAFFD